MEKEEYDFYTMGRKLAKTKNEDAAWKELEIRTIYGEDAALQFEVGFLLESKVKKLPKLEYVVED